MEYNSEMLNQPASRTADGFLGLLADEGARKALLACSAALSLDDDVARRAIALVAGSNGSADALLDRVKSLSCVWREWDGTWYVAEDVRAPLVDRLSGQIPAGMIDRLHELLAEAADRRLVGISPNGQLFDYRVRACHLEAGYHQIQVTGSEETGAERFLAAWQPANREGKDATAAAVDHLAPELERQGRPLPDPVLFLRGMAARTRKDWRRAEKYFRTVWERGRPGEIQAISAHLFGTLTRDQSAAERAFHQSLEWYPEPIHRGQVWHSLGNLLAKERSRWNEAEGAYNESLSLLRDPGDQGQVLHSLGNLLARERSHFSEAENAYRNSLALDPSPQGRGQVWHSLANLLAKMGSRWNEAEDAYNQGLSLLRDPRDQGQVYASWANALLRQAKGRGDLDRAANLAEIARECAPDNPKTCAVAAKVLAEVFRIKGDIRQELEALEEYLDNSRKQYRHRYAKRAEQRIREIKMRMKDVPT